LAQYQIPVVVILANNSGWMAIKDLQTGMLGDKYTFGNDWIKNKSVYTPDFARIAESFGIPAKRISLPAEVAPAVDAAITSGKPAFIEVDVYREFPQSGGDAYGWWDVPIPHYLPEQKNKYEAGKQDEQI